MNKNSKPRQSKFPKHNQKKSETAPMNNIKRKISGFGCIGEETRSRLVKQGGALRSTYKSGKELLM
jgi:hypothetical protein